MDKIHKDIMADAINESIRANKENLVLKRIIGYSLTVNIALVIGIILCMIGI